MENKNITEKELCELALQAMNRSYSPYSRYKVGAALLCKSGKVYLGANIENAAFTPTVCAERVAFFKAISDGEREFLMIAVCGGKDGDADSFFPPCGVCRQVMAEFCARDFEVILCKRDGEYKKYALSEILPISFSAQNIDK